MSIRKVHVLAVVALAALAISNPARAADAAAGLPVKAPSMPQGHDWTGFYGGAHLGYAGGRSDWTANATGAPVPPLSGSLDFFHGFDPFKGTGSYFVGLQAGYNYIFPSRFMLGAEADISFPSTIVGRQTIFSPSIGLASYAETVQLFGTVRARIGYAFNDWLIYGTGGFAWSYDHFARMQLAGMPVGGTAEPGTVESSLKVRTGWAAGAGVEVPVASSWTAKLEYLFTGFNTHSVVFTAAAQRFDPDLALHTVRLGLNHRFDASKPEGFTLPSAPESDIWAFHGQTTYVHQYALPFRAPYRGQNSLASNIGRETWDVTLFAGLRLWSGAELWINPEIDQGFGLSSTLGVGGFPSGEAFKVGASVPYARPHRMFIRQTIGLGGEMEKVEPDLNKFGGSQAADRLVITAGKFDVTDIFDTNKYTLDPRNGFMNWSLINTGSFDYAADAWGYTYGAAVEWYHGRWTLRAGVFDLSIVPNSTELDPRFAQFQSVVEIERRHDLLGQPGKIALTGFLSRGRMGRFADAVQLALLTGGPAEIAAVRRYTSRSGVSLNVEQQLSSDLGVFARAGLASGDVEPFDYTDIDRTIAAGLTLSGKRWGRPDDTFGLAGVVNAISNQHQAFLNAGGLGILVGDGKLPNPGPEAIIEMYYTLPVSFWRLTFDYQFIANPAYNRDRGPVSVLGTRLHAQF